MSNRDRKAGNEKDDELETIRQRKIAEVTEQIKSFKGKGGNTFLHQAVETDDEELVEHSIAAGCDVNEKNNEGDPPVAHAIHKNCVKATKILLQAGASHVNSDFKDSRGPLHIACEKGFADIVQMLIDFGADVNARDKRRWTPLHAVNDWNRNKDREDDDCKIIKALIGAGADIDAKDFFHYTPLCFSINGHLSHSNKRFDLLLSLGADINVEGTLGDNILYDTVYENHPHKCKRLVELGADVNMIDSSGDNLLVGAIMWSNIEIADFLLKKGLDIGAVNFEGYDPICKGISIWVDEMLYKTRGNTYKISETEITEIEDQVKMIDFLVKRGANLNHVTNDGLTSLYIVLQNFYHCRVAEALLRNGATFDFKHATVRKALKNSNKFFHLLLRHAAMFEAQNRSDGPANFDEEKLNKKSKKYYGQCRMELELMKSTKIADTNVSYFNVLVNPNIGAYARNESIVSEFEEKGHSMTFSVYYGLTAEKFFKELEIQKLLRKAEQGLGRLLNWDENSMRLIIDKIIFHLSEKDLMNLADI